MIESSTEDRLDSIGFAALGEGQDTIEDVIEPFFDSAGFIIRHQEVCHGYKR